MRAADPMDEDAAVSATPPRFTPRDDDPLWQEALDWLLRLREAPDSAELRQACRAWAAADPRRAQALRLAGQTWRLSGVPSADARPQPANAEPPPLARPRRQRPRWPVALAAALLLGVATWLGQPSDPNHFSASANRELQLPDGSRVALAAGSELQVEFSTARRHLRLLKGEAFFDVAHDSARPFSVEAGGGEVTVTGTAFDLRADPLAWEVAVARGSVRVQPPRGLPLRQLGPGDHLSLTAQAELARQDKLPVERIGAWRQGQLLASDTPLPELFDQLRRYYPGVLRVDARAFAGKRVTGVYDLRDPRGALQAMLQPFGGKVGGWGPLWLSAESDR
ncbi:FecR family protein [Pseudomonas citronellolis]|uniref:FecR family protein n=1 Tax=Pseudomonas citronellolis TaxID=53408 RepID=UPI0023E44B38|nr:FecR domain-containing protein [Pseudomonas citronellolis]MDF3935626.1 FecR domain-containing protein [Pseudomonas citronellolis]